MKKLLLLSLLLVGCVPPPENPQQSKWKVTQYSGGETVRQWMADNQPSISTSYAEGFIYFYCDNREVWVYGNYSVEELPQ
ncbi:MAG: hypothetical protein DWQ19_08965 [Crenarchaeota archaeon]|nr:MAG: hypothetical protein DWQ19_08965 [Thermoproteota archaeon]